MRQWRKILALAAAFGLAGGAQAAGLDVAYTLRPVLTDGALQALAVEARFRGDADGETRVSLPAAARQGSSFDGAPQMLDQKDGVVLTHQPGAALTVRYEIVPGYAGLPTSQPMEPLLQPDWFVVHGERAFARPEGRDGAHVTFAWRGLPAGWLGVAHAGNGATVGELVDGYLLGGAGWREDTRRIGRARIRILYRPAGWETSPALAFDTLAAAVKAGFDYWDEPPRDFFVPIVQLKRGDFGGRGLADGFQIYAGQDVDLLPQNPRLHARASAFVDLAPDWRVPRRRRQPGGLAERGLQRCGHGPRVAAGRALVAGGLRGRPERNAGALCDLAGARSAEQADPGGAVDGLRREQAALRPRAAAGAALGTPAAG